MNRTDRLHAIHEALRRAGPKGTTAARLAADLEVSARTIKRDVSALQQSGALIWSQPGPGGGYVLDASASLPPVAFTPTQVVALAVAVELLPPGSPFATDAHTAALKVLDTLNPAGRQRAAAISGRVWALRNEGERPVTPSVIRAVERSLAENRALALTYESPEGETTKRTVEPIMTAWGNGRWYLVAHCRMRTDIRWFRLSRIRRADISGEPYTPRPVTDVGTPPPGATPIGA